MTLKRLVKTFRVQTNQKKPPIYQSGTPQPILGLGCVLPGMEPMPWEQKPLSLGRKRCESPQLVLKTSHAVWREGQSRNIKNLSLGRKEATDPIGKLDRSPSLTEKGWVGRKGGGDWRDWSILGLGKTLEADPRSDSDWRSPGAGQGCSVDRGGCRAGLARRLSPCTSVFPFQLLEVAGVESRSWQVPEDLGVLGLPQHQSAHASCDAVQVRGRGRPILLI